MGRISPVKGVEKCTAREILLRLLGKKDTSGLTQECTSLPTIMTYNNPSTGKIVLRLLLLDLSPGQWDEVNACYYKHGQKPQLGKPLALGENL